MKVVNRSLLVSALVVWMGCAALVGISRSLTTVDNSYIIHMVGAPILAAAVSFVYFGRTGSRDVLPTAVTFTLFPMVVDFVVVALIFMRSLEMFTAPAAVIGTWVPLALIFTASYLTGRLVLAGRGDVARVPARG